MHMVGPISLRKRIPWNCREANPQSYPELEWLRVNADGSKIGIHSRAGAGVYCEEAAHLIPFFWLQSKTLNPTCHGIWSMCR